MLIYLASTANYVTLVGKDRKHLVKHFLASYHYYSRNFKFFEMAKGDNIDIFLDSGAFSAWSQKKHININQYVKFIHDCKHLIKTYSVLDDILDYKRTLSNQEYMESNGLNPLPCFHYSEPISVLDKYVDKYEYIALGGMVPISAPQLTHWLDDIFHRHPNTKFHGFGMTKDALLKRYPWHTADSSSWVMGSKFGRVYTMADEIYFGASPDPSSWANRNELEKEHYLKYFTEHGFTIEELFQNYKARNAANVIYFNTLEKYLTDNPPKEFRKNQMEFFTVESVTRKEH